VQRTKTSNVTDRVLLIGKRAAVLTRLQAALREIGIEADLTQDTAHADQSELHEYGAVAFGRAVGEEDRARMRDAFRAANPAVAFVDGLAPITPLLVAQFEQALGRRPEQERRLGDVTVTEGRVKLDLRSQAHVRVAVYRLTRLYRTHTEQLLDERLSAGHSHGEPQSAECACKGSIRRRASRRRRGTRRCSSMTRRPSS
jgi:hypothetical protein